MDPAAVRAVSWTVRRELVAGVNERSTEYARELVAVSPKRLNDRATGTSKHTPEVARQRCEQLGTPR